MKNKAVELSEIKKRYIFIFPLAIKGDLTDLETTRSLPLTTRSLIFIIHYLEE